MLKGLEGTWQSSVISNLENIKSWCGTNVQRSIRSSIVNLIYPVLRLRLVLQRKGLNLPDTGM